MSILMLYQGKHIDASNTTPLHLQNEWNFLFLPRHDFKVIGLRGLMWLFLILISASKFKTQNINKRPCKHDSQQKEKRKISFNKLGITPEKGTRFTFLNILYAYML